MEADERAEYSRSVLKPTTMLYESQNCCRSIGLIFSCCKVSTVFTSVTCAEHDRR
jgi:hypothetical protein